MRNALQAAGGVLMLGIIIAGLASPPTLAAADEPGRAAYLKYCAACHGSEGKGDGLVSSVLRPSTTDLTQLAKRHGGTFPYVAVRESIDGRKRLAAHGDSAMPVWGEIFTEEGALNVASEAQVRGKVQLITDYVATIQAH